MHKLVAEAGPARIYAPPTVKTDANSDFRGRRQRYRRAGPSRPAKN